MDHRYPTAASIGLRIRALRERRGLSVRELAKRANMVHTNLRKIEQGQSDTPIETLARVARVLGVSLGELCTDLPHLPDHITSALAEVRDGVVTVIRRQVALGHYIEGLRQQLSEAGIYVLDIDQDSPCSGPTYHVAHYASAAIA